MNALHRWYCRSDRWASILREKVVPLALQGVELGKRVLEIGPGPGLTTDVLRRMAPTLTALEIERPAAGALRRRLGQTNVRVVNGDAAHLPFADESFTSVVSLTMLHHVPSVGMQDALLAESRRVLRAGGTFVGSDSVNSLRFRLYHLFDTCVPIDPDHFEEKLRRAGFVQVEVGRVEGIFRFRAVRP